MKRTDQEEPEEYRGFEDNSIVKAFFAAWHGVGEALRSIACDDYGGGEGV